MLIEFTDPTGGRHSFDVEPEFAGPVLRVLAAELGRDRVELPAGVRVTGIPTAADWSTFRAWERGGHLEEGGGE